MQSRKSHQFQRQKELPLSTTTFYSWMTTDSKSTSWSNNSSFSLQNLNNKSNFSSAQPQFTMCTWGWSPHLTYSNAINSSQFPEVKPPLIKRNTNQSTAHIPVATYPNWMSFQIRGIQEVCLGISGHQLQMHIQDMENRSVWVPEAPITIKKKNKYLMALRMCSLLFYWWRGWTWGHRLTHLKPEVTSNQVTQQNWMAIGKRDENCLLPDKEDCGRQLELNGSSKVKILWG